MDDCIFCKMANGEISAEKIYENDNFFSILDQDPVFEGHSLIISKKHFETILDLPNSLAPELIDAIKSTSLRVMEKFNAEGINVVSNIKEAAGQVVNHFHVHIIPRKKSDRGKLKFVDKDSGKSIMLRDK